MDVEIMNERENPLLGRKEVKFRVKYPRVGVPARQEVRSKLIAMLDSNKDLTVLDYLKPQYGQHAALGYIKVYDNADAMKVEAKYKIKRNFEVKEKKIGEEAKPEEKPPEGAPEAKQPREVKGESKSEEKASEEKKGKE